MKSHPLAELEPPPSQSSSISGSPVYSLYKECGVTPTKEMAQIMAAGILADTDSLTATKGTASDSVALSQLYKLGEIDNPSELWQGILAAQSSYDGMTDEEICKVIRKSDFIPNITAALQAMPK